MKTKNPNNALPLTGGMMEGNVYFPPDTRLFIGGKNGPSMYFEYHTGNEGLFLCLAQDDQYKAQILNVEDGTGIPFLEGYARYSMTRVALEDGTILQNFLKKDYPFYFVGSAAKNFSDAPKSMYAGFGVDGVAFPHDATSWGVFAWQARDENTSLWFRAVKNNEWSIGWKKLSATDD